MAGTRIPATNPLRASRRRRWWIGVSIAALVLVLYAGALTWTTRRLQADIQKSIHALPDVSTGHRDGD